MTIRRATMQNEKMVQVTENMLLNTYKLLYYLKAGKDTTELENVLQGQINAKFDQLAKRESFTAYKTAPRGTEEREKARQEYIKNHAEISKDFQTKNEIEV